MMYQVDRARFVLPEEEWIFQCNFKETKSSQRQTLLRVAKKKEDGQQSQVVAKEVQLDTKRKKFTALQRDTVESPLLQIFKTQLNKVLINLIELQSSPSLKQEIQLDDFQRSLPN